MYNQCYRLDAGQYATFTHARFWYMLCNVFCVFEPMCALGSISHALCYMQPKMRRKLYVSHRVIALRLMYESLYHNYKICCQLHNVYRIIYDRWYVFVDASLLSLYLLHVIWYVYVLCVT